MQALLPTGFFVLAESEQTLYSIIFQEAIKDMQGAYMRCACEHLQLLAGSADITGR